MRTTKDIERERASKETNRKYAFPIII
jgi:hypothetical protein